jgi:hypothetical protein
MMLLLALLLAQLLPSVQLLQLEQLLLLDRNLSSG